MRWIHQLQRKTQNIYFIYLSQQFHRMEASSGNYGQGGGIPRHQGGSMSTKNSKSGHYATNLGPSSNTNKRSIASDLSKDCQYLANHNLQHLIHSQITAGQQPNSTKSAANFNSKQPYSAKMGFEGAASNVSTPTVNQQNQQRAYTQLYQQQTTPMSGKQASGSTKNLQNSSSGYQKQSTKSYAAGAHKKDSASKQVDLQAKFASLLKQSKDSAKEKAMHSMPSSAKQDKKGEKRDQAANARNQLFGESSGAQKGQKEKGGRDSGRPPAANHTSPLRTSALRQTPLTQQMLIIQNSTSPVVTRPPSQNQALKTFQGPLTPMIDPKSQTTTFPRQASMSITNPAIDNFMHQVSNKEATVPHPGRQSQQFTSAPRGSNSRTREKKGRASTSAQRSAANPSNHGSEPARTTYGASESTKVNRNSQVTTSSKSKKKKQQPSQQQVNIDPVEEYLANATRLQQQMQTLNNLPNAANNTPIQQLDSTPVAQSEPNSNFNSQRDTLEPNFSAAMSSIHSQSAQILFQHQPQTQSTPAIEALESQLLASFKAKCQQEMQTQTKQAVAKLLYTKREVMMEIKAIQSTLKSQQSEPTPKERSAQKQKEVEPVFDEQKVYDIINTQMNNLEVNYKTGQEKSNQMFDDRIDDVLLQIQSILSGLEDTFYAKTGKLESDVLTLTDNAEQLKSQTDTKIESAIQISKHALEQLKDTQTGLQKYVDKHYLETELESLRRDQSPVKMPEFFDKNTDEIAFIQQQLGLVDNKINEIQETIIDQAKITNQNQNTFTDTQDKVQEALDETNQRFETLLANTKVEIGEIVAKQIAQREVTLESKLEKSKQQFLKAVNGNMRILDNLISDYTTRTHDQIKQQLRSGPPSRGHTSNRLTHSVNDAEELQSMRGSVNADSTSNQPVKHYQKTLEALTAQSLQMPGSLSSVQDVSDTNKLADEDMSSQLLSTTRDRQLQAEAASNSIRQGRGGSNIPPLQIQQVQTAQTKIGANSERNSKPTCFSQLQERGFAQENPLDLSDANNHAYGTPQRVLLQHHDTMPLIQNQTSDMDDKKIIIVEEKKFVESREGSNDSKDTSTEPEVNQRDLDHDHNLEGDLKERSMEMVSQVQRQDLPSPQIRQPLIRQSSTETKQRQFQEQLAYDLKMHNGAAAIHVLSQAKASNYDDEVVDESSKYDGEEPIDFALSTTSPYMVRSGGAPNGIQSSCDTNSLGNENIYNYGYASMQNGNQQRSLSLRQKPGKMDNGAISSRLTKTLSQMQHGNNTVATTVKQETTDSDFFNLTDEGESQMDPILVMRNLSNTQLCSATTSMIQIQENQEQKQSFQNFLNERPQTQDPIQNDCQAQAYQILDIEQIPSQNSEAKMGENGNQAIMTYEPVVVQTIGNRFKELKNVKEFTPEQTHDLQQSYDNIQEEVDPRNLVKSPLLTGNHFDKAQTPSDLRMYQASVESPQMEIQGGAPDKSLGDESLTIAGKQGQPLTNQQARRSSMVFMEERQPVAKQPQISALLEPTTKVPQPQKQPESSSYSSSGKAIANQTYTRGKKPGSDLPPNLQRRGNEIIHQLLLDEVIAALDDVIQMSGDKLNDIILDQHKEITISNRNLIRQSRTTKRRVATRDEDGVMLDNSDRYELSDQDSLTIQIDQSQEQEIENSLEENHPPQQVPAQASQGEQEIEMDGNAMGQLQDQDDVEGMSYVEEE